MKGFGSRLERVIHRIADMNQKKLAKQLGVSEALVSNWVNDKGFPSADLLQMICTNLRCSADELLGLRLPEKVYEGEHECDGIRWIEKVPQYIVNQQREVIERGLELFRSLVVDKNSPAVCTSKLGADWQTLNNALLMALRTRSLQLVNVPRHDSLEAELRGRFGIHGLREVIVAKVPQTSAGKYIAGAILRTEFVTFLAATVALASLDPETRAVGVGGGYTMLRFAEQSVLCPSPFSKTTWIPLMARNDAGFEASGRSANSVASLMAIQRPGSKALPFPFIAPEKRPRLSQVEHSELEYDERQATIAINRFKNANTFFVTVGGENYDAVLALEDYSVNARERINNVLRRQNLANQFAGDMLGVALNDEGESIGSEVQSINDNFAFTIGFERIRRLTEINRTWVIANMSYKSRAVLMTLKSKLVNSLVVDSEIAEYLSKNSE